MAAHPTFQLPTPRATRSPSPGLGDSRGSSPLTPTTAEAPSAAKPGPDAPQTGLHTPPISPSKRNADNRTPILSESPSKKPRPPQTGTPASPGRGNLFAGPEQPLKEGAVGANAGCGNDEWEDEVFISGVLGMKEGGKVAKVVRRGLVGVQRKASLNTPMPTPGDKENAAPVTMVVSLTAAEKAGTKKMVEEVVGRRKGMRSAPVRGG